MPRRASRPPTSAICSTLLEGASRDALTFGELLHGFGERSFGVLLLILALVSLVPGLSIVIGVVLAILSVQMLFARRTPWLPRFIMARRISGERIARIARRLTPVLVRIERVVRPRWAIPYETTKRVVGGVVLLLAITLIAPIPFSNYLPALVIILVALAYLEEDGLLLSLGLAAAIVSLAVTGAEIWATISAAKWLGRL